MVWQARCGAVWRGVIGQGKAGKVRYGELRQGAVWLGRYGRYGKVRQGLVWYGKVRQGVFGRVALRFGMAGLEA